MRSTKNPSKFKIQNKNQEILQSYHEQVSKIITKRKKIETQADDHYFERFQNCSLLKISDSQQKTNRFLKKIIKCGDSSRKMYFNKQIQHCKRNLNSIRWSQATKNDKDVYTQYQKQNRMTLLRLSINYQPKKMAIVSQKRQRQMNITFSKLLKEIKLKNFVRVDDQSQNQIRKFQAYASTQKGQKHSINQDSMMYSEGIYIICDGHGANGKQISQFIAQTTYKFIKDAISEGKVDIDILKSIMKKTEIELDLSGIDIAFSGSTFICIVIYENSIFCISIGDSRAILSQGLAIKQLGVIHKPDLKAEKDRIERCGGVIHPLEVGKDKYAGPNRIWAPGKTSWGPGLALSRAFGDKASRKYGVISQAQISQNNICYDNKFIVLGSDGLFDFMKQTEVSFFIRKRLKDCMYCKEQICEQLVEEAKRIGQAQSDDTTCIIIFF